MRKNDLLRRKFPLLNSVGQLYFTILKGNVIYIHFKESAVDLLKLERPIMC
jgi:hypothetical protein